MRLPYVQQKELEIENTLDKIRNQLAAMRSQDATLHRQVSRIKANIEDITLEIQAMTRSRIAIPMEANPSGGWNIGETPISAGRTTRNNLVLQPPQKIQRLSVSPQLPLPRGTTQFYEPVVYEPTLWDEGTPATLGRERSASEPKPRLSGSVGSVNSIASTSSRLSSDMQATSPLASVDCDKEQDNTVHPRSPSSSTSGKGRRRLSRALSSFRRARVSKWLLRRFSTADQSDSNLSGTETESSTTI